ncbi:7-cyano-7-deazaguanine synthase [uncultured archaeon]|nr:7-cyano-7-deazaguanine synthase [uncultured archaeon]
MASKKKGSALVVLSGGQDSVTCLYWALLKYEWVEAVTFNYGQKHSREIGSAIYVAELAGVQHEVVDVPGILRSSSPLTDPTAQLEKYENFEQMEKVIGNRVELTFVPMRNAFFLTLAANYALSKGIRTLVTGVCQEDNANYPDCRQSFINSQVRTINLALGIKDFKIVTPLMNMSKAGTVLFSLDLPGAYKALGYSHTSYDGAYPPVDNNHSNVLRAQGFLVAGVPDPLVLRAYHEGLMDLPNSPNYAPELVQQYLQLAGLLS